MQQQHQPSNQPKSETTVRAAHSPMQAANDAKKDEPVVDEAKPAVLEAPLGDELCSLFNQEFFLMKMLQHLVEDGLHECRRVCRKWKAECSKMGVHLMARSPEDIPALVEIFSSATSVRACFESPHFDQHGNLMHYCVRRNFFTNLAALRSLKDLALKTSGNWAFESSEVTLSCLTQLQSLEIWMHGDINYITSLYSSLRFLTRLTRLALKTPDVGFLQLDPFRELTRIKELEVCLCLLRNEGGQLLFPPSQSLTRLTLGYDPPPGQYKDSIPRAILPYARTVRSLEFDWSDEGLDICFANSLLRVLPCFETLERLALLELEEASVNLFEVLGTITRLTSLDVECGWQVPTLSGCACYLLFDETKIPQTYS